MPIRQEGQGKWYWGKQGPFKTREQAVDVAQAAYASGYSKSMTQLKQWLTKEDDDYQLELPPANLRVYIHEGKPSPKGVKVFDAGNFKGGHKGVEFWLTTDKNAHNALEENGHEIRELPENQRGGLLGDTPFYAAHKGEDKPVRGEGSGFRFAAAKTKEDAIKDYHDMIHPLRPDDTLNSLVIEGKVDLPEPAKYTDGKLVHEEDFKGDRLTQAVTHHGEDTLAKDVLYLSDMVKNRFDGEINSSVYGDAHENLSGYFPYQDRFSYRMIGNDFAEGRRIITDNMVNKAAKKIYDHAQESLDKRGLSDEFWVYRGQKTGDYEQKGSNDVLSVSLQPATAEIFASQRGRKEIKESAPSLSAFKVKKTDILADVAAYYNNPYGEEELLIDVSSLNKAEKKTAKLPDIVWQPSTMKMLKFIQAEMNMEKAWITNPRGDGKNGKQNKKYIEGTEQVTTPDETAAEYVQKVWSQGIPFDTVNPANDNKRKKVLKKEGGGDGGGGDGGSFGGGEGTVFTSENAGIFTPTHTDRGKRRKRRTPTGVDRLNDFITERSPEKKMQKGFATELVEWATNALRKYDDSDTVDDYTWKPAAKKYSERLSSEREQLKNPVEFDASPSKTAAMDQKDEETRIKQLDDEEHKDDATPETGQASDVSPAGLNIQFGWDASGSQDDSLARGGSQDTLYEEEDEDRIKRELRKEYPAFFQQILNDLDK